MSQPTQYEQFSKIPHYEQIVFIYMKRIIDRFKLLVRIENIKMPWLEEQTNIVQKRWSNVKAENSEMRATEVEALNKVFPEYSYWLATGNEMPEAGQISPMTKLTQQNLKQTGTDSK